MASSTWLPEIVLQISRHVESQRQRAFVALASRDFAVVDARAWRRVAVYAGGEASALAFCRVARPSAVEFVGVSLENIDSFLRLLGGGIADLRITSGRVPVVPLRLLDAISDHAATLKTLSLTFEAVDLPSTLAFTGHMALPHLEELCVVELSPTRNVGVRLCSTTPMPLATVLLRCWWSDVLVVDLPALRNVTYFAAGDSLEDARLEHRHLDSLHIEAFFFTDVLHVLEELARGRARGTGTCRYLSIDARVSVTIDRIVADEIRCIAHGKHDIRVSQEVVNPPARAHLCAPKVVVTDLKLET